MRWSRRWGSSTSRWRPREPEEAARRSDAGGADSDAARRRVAATLDAARRVELGRLVVGVPGPETEAARRRALAAARTVGRSGLVDEGRGAAVAYVTQAFAAQGYSGSWIMTETSVSVTRPEDRAAVAEALADAVTADAVENLADADSLSTLRAPWGALAGSATIPDPGSIASFASSLAELLVDGEDERVSSRR